MTVGRWMAIRKSRERDVFVFFSSWKVFRRGCIIYSFGTELLSARLSLLALGGRLFPLTKQQKKNDQRMTRFPPLFVDCVSTGDQSGQARQSS